MMWVWVCQFISLCRLCPRYLLPACDQAVAPLPPRGAKRCQPPSNPPGTASSRCPSGTMPHWYWQVPLGYHTALVLADHIRCPHIRYPMHALVSSTHTLAQLPPPRAA